MEFYRDGYLIFTVSERNFVEYLFYLWSFLQWKMSRSLATESSTAFTFWEPTKASM